MSEDIAVKWTPGLIIKAKPSKEEKEKILVYVQKNYLGDTEGNRYWFNEDLFPLPQVGYILFVNLDEKPNNNLSYEIVEVIPK